MPHFNVPEELAGTRLDSLLSALAGISRSAAARLIANQEVSLCGKITTDKNHRAAAGDSVDFSLPESEPCEAQPENIKLDVVYEDSDIIVINKPAGMVVHPAVGNPRGTLVNALLAHCGNSLSGIGGKLRPGIVHRIDKDTSGLLVAAKNDAAHVFMSEQLKEHKIERIYYAVAVGNVRDDSGTIDADIGRNPTDRKKMAVIEKFSGLRARRAVTHYTVIERYSGYTLIKLKLETGRTHQIRVHMAYMGHPLFGDSLYGAGHTKPEKEFVKLHEGQALVAKELYLVHPISGNKMCFKCDFPDYFDKLLFKLRELSK